MEMNVLRRLLLVASLVASPLAFAGDQPAPETVVPIDTIDAEALDSLRAKLDAHRAAGQALEARLHEVLAAIARKHSVALDRLRVDLAHSRLTVAPLTSDAAPVGSRGR